MEQSHDKLIMTVNAGSSSIKIGLFKGHPGQDVPVLFAGAKFDGIGTLPRMKVTRADGSLATEKQFDPKEAHDQITAFKLIFPALLSELHGQEPALIAHRIVHGGEHYTEPVLMNQHHLQELKKVIPLAPLHEPFNLAPIEQILNSNPTLPQVACFDTAFHANRSELSMLTGLPYSYYEQGIRRYGFHGLSFEYISHQLHHVAPSIANGKVIIAHLGSGVGLCSIENGKCVEVTTSFTALDGVPMGSRTGTLDPGVMLYLVGQGKTYDELENILYRQSGLLGISGISNDMRTLRSSGDKRAQLAIDYFAYHIAQQIGRLAVTVGGLDGLVFTAGIGEKDAKLRSQVVRYLEPIFKLELDEQANEGNAFQISSGESQAPVLVIPTDEESMLAKHAWKIYNKL